MEVTFNEDKFKVKWRYTNTQLEEWLKVLCITREAANQMTHFQLLEVLSPLMKFLRIKSIPHPDVTECVIYDEEGDICVGKTFHNPKDSYSKEKARKYSLKDALIYFPGKGYLELRREFWKVYLSRHKTKMLMGSVLEIAE